MNIALLIPTLTGGGAERVAQLIGNYYVDRGNKVYYFLADTPIRQVYPVKGQIVNTGIKSCLSNNIYGDIQIVQKLIMASFQMKKLKKKYKIDVAVSFMEEFNYINILSKGREKVITRICTILSARGEWADFFQHRNLIHFFYPKADKVVVMSNYAKEDMYRNYGVPINKMVKIPNAVRTTNDDVLSLDWQYGDKTVITVGRLVSEKQQERIIRAFSYVNKYEKDARLLILGTGAKEKYLKVIVGKCGLEGRVIFAGFQRDVVFYLKNSKVFVLASRLEGFPNSMVEAMANGLPVVTTDSPGGCGEIVGRKRNRGKCEDIEYCPFGILTPYISGKERMEGDLEEKELLLGKAILELLENNNLREKYSKQSLRRASMYSIEKVMDKWDKLLQI